MYIGYARVSTQNQSLSLQLETLYAAGHTKVFVEQVSSVQCDRPQQQATPDWGPPSDTPVVWKLDGLA
jgi:DNA invertase Pin-like site-specific DNA recombinase